VWDHSDFRSDPLKRLRRTLDATLAIVFGTTSEADRAAAQIRAVHARVHGVLAEDGGRFPAGTPYRAEDPDLLVWVNATLFDASVRTYELLFDAIAPGDLERLYDDSKQVLRMLGAPPEAGPASLRAFRESWDRRLDEDLAVGARTRELAEMVMRPKLRFVPSPAFAPVSLLTIGLMPERARELYGFRWNAARERAFRAEARTVGAVARALPPRLRFFPQAIAADKRATNRRSAA
jgi:uncharacterized protein (DUF2236 family)